VLGIFFVSVFSAISVVKYLFQDRCAKEREHDFVVSGEVEPAPPFKGGPPDHIGERTVVGDKIHVDRGEMFGPVALVADQGQGLQKTSGRITADPRFR